MSAPECPECGGLPAGEASGSIDLCVCRCCPSCGYPRPDRKADCCGYCEAPEIRVELGLKPLNRHETAKDFIVGHNQYGIGLDIGWRIHDVCCLDFTDVWWGNTKDEASLLSLKADMARKGQTYRDEIRLDKGAPRRRWEDPETDAKAVGFIKRAFPNG